jgi:hypothetical protein
MAEACGRMNKRDDDEVRELVEVLRCKQNFEAGRALGIAARQKCFEAACHVKVVEEFGGCAGSGWIEIRSTLTKVSRTFRLIWSSPGCGLLFSGVTNEGAVEEKKQTEVSSDGALEWARAPGARAGAPCQAARVSPSLVAHARAGRSENSRVCTGAGMREYDFVCSE